MTKRIPHNKGKFKYPWGGSHHKIDRVCPNCSEVFQTTGRNITRGQGIYCSRKCNPKTKAKFTKTEKARKHNLSSKYGLTQYQYDELLVLQGGGCAICGATEGNEKHKNLFVDHCHKFGSVRGLLCGRCNSAISLLRDCPETIRSALFYVLTYGGSTPSAVDDSQLPADQLYDFWLQNKNNDCPLALLDERGYNQQIGSG